MRIMETMLIELTLQVGWIYWQVSMPAKNDDKKIRVAMIR
jgi:hypothetical protein